MILRDSNPGEIRFSPGGVGHNIAHNLVLLGGRVSMLTALGDDLWAESVRRSCIECGVDLSEAVRVPGGRTSGYLYVTGPDGDLTVGLCDTDIAKHISPDFLALPELGQLYGGKGTMELEALMASGAEVVIDIGEAKGSMAEDLDKLSAQTGIPFVHVNSTMTTVPETYRALGKLLGLEEKAETLASWCENVLTENRMLMETVDAAGARRRVVYCLGDRGLNCLAKGSYHAGVIDMVADNAAVLPEVMASGLGNEIDMEQLLLWNPEVILLAPDQDHAAMAADEAWQLLDAGREGQFYQSPFGPYGWTASPPGVQQYLGLLWLEALLYPAYVPFTLKDRVTEYYGLFYDYTLTDAGYAALTRYALP
mgnify:CR=1 FL=1